MNALPARAFGGEPYFAGLLQLQLWMAQKIDVRQGRRKTMPALAIWGNGPTGQQIVKQFLRRAIARLQLESPMKVIGLLGGMSWESTTPYYRLINETVRDRLGGHHSAHVILYSLDFDAVKNLQHAGDWHTAGAIVASAALALERAGAECIVLCTNTMHKVAHAIESAVSIPLLHIADATAEPIKRAGLTTVGLLATRFTMEDSFYRDRLEDRHALRVLTPDADDRAVVHRIIYDELCLGRVEPASREEYRRIIAGLAASGAQAIVLACTEITLLVSQQDSPVPVFDTTALHAIRAVDWALMVSGPGAQRAVGAGPGVPT